MSVPTLENGTKIVRTKGGEYVGVTGTILEDLGNSYKVQWNEFGGTKIAKNAVAPVSIPYAIIPETYCKRKKKWIMPKYTTL